MYKSTNAVLTDYGGDKNGVPIIIFHAALGTMNSFRLLIKHLLNQDIGPVIGVTIADLGKYCKLTPENLIKNIAKDYANQLQKTGYKNFQLIGYSFGGLIANEVADILDKSDLSVLDMVLIDSIPVLYDFKDDFLLESFFLSSLNISFEKQISKFYPEVSPSEITKGIINVLEHQRKGFFSDKSFYLDGKLKKAGDVFKYLNGLSKKERFEIYFKNSSSNKEFIFPLEMAEVLFEVYSKSVMSSKFPLTPYKGDLRLLRAKNNDFFDMEDDVLNYWKNLCLGKFLVSEIDGDHYTCIHTDQNAKKLAEKITKPLMHNS